MSKIAKVILILFGSIVALMIVVVILAWKVILPQVMPTESETAATITEVDRFFGFPRIPTGYRITSAANSTVVKKLTMRPITKRGKGFFEITLSQTKSIWSRDLQATPDNANDLSKSLYSLTYGSACTSKGKGAFSQRSELLFAVTRMVKLVRVHCETRHGTMTAATTTFSTRRGMVTVSALAVGSDKDFDTSAVRSLIGALL